MTNMFSLATLGTNQDLTLQINSALEKVLFRYFPELSLRRAEINELYKGRGPLQLSKSLFLLTAQLVNVISNCRALHFAYVYVRYLRNVLRAHASQLEVNILTPVHEGCE
jgi:hypothetical protein